jgi:hypothetical protein
MNRLLVPLMLIALIAMTVDCRDDAAMPKGSRARPADASKKETLSPERDSLRLDSLFDLLRQQESSLSAYPSNERLAQELLSTALDSAAGCFYTVGKGTIDTTFPEKARALRQKNMAKYASEKWALYCKAWLSGKKNACRTPITGKVLYGQDIRARSVDDTLFLMRKVPVGSVVVK